MKWEPHLLTFRGTTATIVFGVKHTNASLLNSSKMYFPPLALFFSAIALAVPADATDLDTPVVKTITSLVSVTGTTVDTVVTKTASPKEEAMSIMQSEVAALEPTYPSWVKSVLETAIPTTWEEELVNNPVFANSEMNAEKSGIMPGWYSSLPSDVKYILTSDEAVFASELATIKWPSVATSTFTATAGSSTHTAGSSITSSSSSSSTISTTASGSTATKSTTPETSTSTGGAPAATRGFVTGIVGAAGILGLTAVL